MKICIVFVYVIYECMFVKSIGKVVEMLVFSTRGTGA
jgi:hypothetical protein